jgi:plastocyanin domain-containing protein
MRASALMLLIAGGIALSATHTARADDSFTTTIRGHRFEPAEIRVPADKRISLTVVNDDPTPEEFDSKSLKVEKVIPGNSKGVVQFGPLKAGTYKFEGEFNSSTAKGVVIAE